MFIAFAMKRWPEDWKTTLLTAVKNKGHSTVTSLLVAIPLVGFKELALRLSGKIIPYQLQRVYYEEAVDSNTLRAAAIDSMLRRFRDCVPNGWMVDKESLGAGEANLTATWIAELAEASPAMKPIAEGIAKSIFMRKPPEGWMPDGAGDPILGDIFGQHWPRESGCEQIADPTPGH